MKLISTKIKNFIMKYFDKYVLLYSTLSLSPDNMKIFIFVLLISIYIFTINCSKIYRSKLISSEKMKDLDSKIRSTCDLDSENNIQDIKENIKIINKKIEHENNKKKYKSKDPYNNDKNLLNEEYKNNFKNHNFIVNVNNNICSTPLFNMRTIEDLGYYFNFIIHNFDTTKINNLIMCKDIHKWMSNSSLSDEDIEDNCFPIYFIKKIGDSIEVFEYLKLFVNTNKNNVKIAFIQKGIDYLIIENDINELIEKELIKDLLNDKQYNNYNLSTNDDVQIFLENLLSLVLVPEKLVGDKLILDIENYVENKKTFEYYFNTINADLSMFNTCI